MQVTNNDSFFENDNGYTPEDILDDTQSSFSDKNVLAYFKICLQCKEKNSNPSFQFCNKCFRVSKCLSIIMVLFFLFICV